jgi:hypothetical protein
MTTITKERIELFIKNPLENGLTRGEQMELARIALASLEAEPVAKIIAHYPLGIDVGKQKFVQAIGELPDFGGYLFAAPPAPIVPEEKPMPNPLSMYAVDAVAAIAEVRGWNSCRAAMLHGAEPVSQTYKLPVNTPCQDAPAHIWLQTAGVWPELFDVPATTCFLWFNRYPDDSERILICGDFGFHPGVVGPETFHFVQFHLAGGEHHSKIGRIERVVSHREQYEL